MRRKWGKSTRRKGQHAQTEISNTPDYLLWLDLSWVLLVPQCLYLSFHQRHLLQTVKRDSLRKLAFTRSRDKTSMSTFIKEMSISVVVEVKFFLWLNTTKESHLSFRLFTNTLEGGKHHVGCSQLKVGSLGCSFPIMLLIVVTVTVIVPKWLLILEVWNRWQRHNKNNIWEDKDTFENWEGKCNK